MSVSNIVLTDFSAGLHTERATDDLPLGAAVVAQNVSLEHGDLRVRPGRVAQASLPAGTTAGFRALAEYYKAGASPACRLVGVSGAKLYWTTNAAQSTIAAVTEEVSDVHASNAVRMATMHDNLYITDGSSAVKRLASTGTLTSLVDVQVPTVEPGLTRNSLAVMMGAAHANDAQGSYLANPTGSDLADPTVMFIPQLIDWGTGTNGLVVRQYDTLVYGSADGATAMEFVTNGSILTNVMTAKGRMYMDLGSAGVDYSGVQRLLLRFFAAVTYVNSVRASLQFADASHSTVPTDDADWITLDIDLTNCFSTEGVYNERVIEIPSTIAEQLTAVRWLAVRLECGGCTPAVREEYAAGIALDTYTNAVHFVLDGIYPQGFSLPYFTTGTYEITYAYESAAGNTGREYQRSTTPLYPTLSTDNEYVFNVEISCTLDAVVGDGYDTIHVYARGGTSGYFREITPDGGVSVTPEGDPYLLTWDGNYRSDAAFLEEYIGVPPSGASICFPWRGRMLYVAPAPSSFDQRTSAHDTLYFSNKDDAERVPTHSTALTEVPITYGGWEPVGTLGEAIVGLGAIGSYLLVFKASSVYLVTGSPGQPDFRIDELTRNVGCTRHETVQSVDGRMVIWLDDTRVWGFDGSQFLPIGEAIRTSLASTTSSQRATAFAWADQSTRRYGVTIPASGSPAVTPSSTTYVLEMAATGQSLPWVQWSAQPGGCAVYSGRTTTIGVYLGDLYGATALGRLFRLSESTFTDAPSGTGSAAAIAWSWISRLFREPFPMSYKQVGSLLARVQVPTSADAQTVTLTVYPNGSTANAISLVGTIRNLLLTHDGLYEGMVEWIVPLHRESDAVEFGISGSASGAVRVLQLECAIYEGGRRHGHTYARS